MEGFKRCKSPPYILDIPSKVMKEFCVCMDCLSEWEWMRFASSVISDQTVLRQIRLLERTGVSVTWELMWTWGQKMATLQELLELLQQLELYRAAGILKQWTPLSVTVNGVRDRREHSPVKELDSKETDNLPHQESPVSLPSEPPVFPKQNPNSPPLERLQSLSIHPEKSQIYPTHK
ncbi:hypothetical protein GDO86_020106, partial [Hymenochirus boettgeri]